jgi:hypothetical protein
MIISSYTLKSKWDLCKICGDPFLTCTFSNICKNCEKYEKDRIIIIAKLKFILLLFIIIYPIFATGLFFLLDYFKSSLIHKLAGLLFIIPPFGYILNKKINNTTL